LRSYKYIYEILYWRLVDMSDILDTLALVACAPPSTSFIPDIWGKRSIYPKTLAPKRPLRGHRREPPKWKCTFSLGFNTFRPYRREPPETAGNRREPSETVGDRRGARALCRFCVTMYRLAFDPDISTAM
jgi:hypothetical protein